MAILPVGIGPQEGGYQIERSLRFNSADSAYLDRTPASAGNRKTWTWSAWVKRSALGVSQLILNAGAGSGDRTSILFESTDTLNFFTGTTGPVYRGVITTAVFRDVSAWYHIVVAVDTTQATDTNRVKLYVNGVQQAVTTYGGGYNTLNQDTNINTTTVHNIGRQAYNASTYLSAYLTEINFIDGSALDPTSFGEYNTDTGVWQPKAYTGSYGTNGFYLNFSDNSGVTSTTLGADSSGNGNNWTPNNFSVTAGAGNDSLVDTPTNYGTDTGVGGEVRGNYATLNAISNLSTGATLSNGNLDVVTQSSGDSSIPATIYVNSGKWYCEALINSVSAGTNALGIVPETMPSSTGPGYTATSYAYISSGNKANNSSQTAYGASYTTNDVIGIALDLDAGTLTFYKNGVSQGQAFSSISGTYTFAFGEYGSSSSAGYTTNFGQRPFAYTAPSGFKALCTQNLPEPTIVDGGEYFNTVLYTGNGSTQSITNVGFEPSFVWIKERSSTSGHALLDQVRGVNQIINSNSTAAEVTSTSLTAFTSTGFDLGVSTGVNENTQTYVAWNWKANGAGVVIPVGEYSTDPVNVPSIASTVSANTDSGFSIVTYTSGGANATVGHGLGVAPSMIIRKARNASSQNNWYVYHQSLSANGALFLNLTDAYFASSNYWNDTAPTSTVFSVGSATSVLNDTWVAYCFAAIPGYSAFGSYTGNGSADGPFVYTGFRPAFVMYKRTDSTANWLMLDTSLNPANNSSTYLLPNSSASEGTDNVFDILSNGFKIRNTFSSTNASGGTYIYMAFSEVGFKYSLGR